MSVCKKPVSKAQHQRARTSYSLGLLLSTPSTGHKDMPLLPRKWLSQSREILRTLLSKWYRTRPYCVLDQLFCVTWNSVSCPCPPGPSLLQWLQPIQAFLGEVHPIADNPPSLPTCLGSCGTWLKWPMKNGLRQFWVSLQVLQKLHT